MTQKSLSQIDILTLAAIARLGVEAAYGVTLRQEIADFAGREVSMAAVYATLERLELRGLVRPSLSGPLPERGGRARRQYSLTDTGRELVRRERANALRLWRAIRLHE